MKIVYKNMKILRISGNNLPINIKLIIQSNKKLGEDYYLIQ